MRLASSMAIVMLLSAVSAAATVAVRPAATEISTTSTTAGAPEAVPPAETLFVQTEHQTRPALLAEGVHALDVVPIDQGWRSAWNPRGLSFAQMLHAGVAAPLLVPIAIVGGVLIMTASLARRRRRRRLGWGFLPERQRAPRERN